MRLVPLMSVKIMQQVLRDPCLITTALIDLLCQFDLQWRTVCLTLPVSTLKSACSSLIAELRGVSSYVPALSLTSALCHRLNYLALSGSNDALEMDKEAMFSEAARLATFTKWPHMNYK